MNATTLKQWFSQITTGIGALVGTPTVIALLSGQITWQQAIPPLVAAVIGLVWPENQALPQQGQAVATDIERLLVAYRTGLQHGTVAALPVAPASPAV